MRVAIVGNSAGGKSVLARKVAHAQGLPCIELDSLLWEPGWTLVPAEEFDRRHAAATDGDSWVIEGLGAKHAIAPRLRRATHIVLIDMPAWTHYWLAAERHVEWQAGRLSNPPAGLTGPAPLKALFETIAVVDRTWLPEIRSLVTNEAKQGKTIFRLETFEQLSNFDPGMLAQT